MIPTVCILLERALNKILILIVNVGYKDVGVSRGHTLVYLIPAQYESLSQMTI